MVEPLRYKFRKTPRLQGFFVLRFGGRGESFGGNKRRQVPFVV